MFTSIEHIHEQPMWTIISMREQNRRETDRHFLNIHNTHGIHYACSRPWRMYWSQLDERVLKIQICMSPGRNYPCVKKKYHFFYNQGKRHGDIQSTETDDYAEHSVVHNTQCPDHITPPRGNISTKKDQLNTFCDRLLEDCIPLCKKINSWQFLW